MNAVEPRANPLAGNPLVTRGDVQQAVRDLVEPIVPNMSAGHARARLGSFGAAFEQRVAELEGYARPLWGIVPLVLGGGRFDHLAEWADGLASGTDPEHPEYWGPCGPTDQRMVEMAAIGVALALIPERFWDPLTGRQRDHVIEWLRGVERSDPVPNNWQFFRLLTQLGLERVGAGIDRDAQQRSIELIESYYRGDGWYVDGVFANADYYVPFAFHTYGLLIAASGLGDRSAAERYLERAHQFAPDFRHWFADDGGAVPFGRSLTYRFAQGSFWGALALADEEALPWADVKGLSLRHLRWWSQWPISDRDGVLSIGYGYDNRRMGESYSSAGSPYWAMKAFLMLAAAADHPFWTSDEAPLPPADVATMEQPGMVMSHAPGNAVMFVAQPSMDWTIFEQNRAKYRKFAYSSRWAFSGDIEAMFGPPVTDSTLAVTDAATGERRCRDAVATAKVADGMAYSRWYPWVDVRVDSVVYGGAEWHGRIHRIETGRPIATCEAGFALPREPDGYQRTGATADLVGPGAASAASDEGRTTIVDIPMADHDFQPVGSIRQLPVNANLLRPHAVVPCLDATLPPGTHLLACSVGASSDAAAVLPDGALLSSDAALAFLLEMIRG